MRYISSTVQLWPVAHLCPVRPLHRFSKSPSTL